MVRKILWLLISLAILAFASPVIDKLALARRFGPLKKVVSFRISFFFFEIYENF